MSRTRTNDLDDLLVHERLITLGAEIPDGAERDVVADLNVVLTHQRRRSRYSVSPWTSIEGWIDG